jgi:hypothetical protein
MFAALTRPRPLLSRLGLAPSSDLAQAVELLKAFVEQESNAARLSYSRGMGPCSDDEWWESDPDGYDLVRRAQAVIDRASA